MSNPQDVNPYATPAKFEELPPPDRGVLPIGAPLRWEPMQALRFGWDAVVRQPLVVLAWFVGTIVGSSITYIGMIAQFALQANDQEVLGWIAYCAGLLLGMPLSIWMHMGLVRYTLKLARGQAPGFGEIFAGGPLFPLIGASLLVALGVTVGFALLIVPGVVLALGWVFVTYLVIERRVGVLDAFGASWRATNGSKLSLLVLGLLCFAALLVGMLAFCIGYLVAIPVCMIALAYVYLKVTGEEPVLPPKFS